MGNVGATVAYTIVSKNLCDKLIVSDINFDKALADAIDLDHAMAFKRAVIDIKAAVVEDIRSADILIVSASVPWSKEYTSRFDLAQDNIVLFEGLIPLLAENNPNAIFLIISNPVDVMTFFTYKFSGFDVNKVLGVGTLIDSARFRKNLSKKYDIHPDDIRAYVLGEHGQTQFSALSVAFAGGEKIRDRELAHELLDKSASSAYQIVKGKGYSNFAISMATALMVESIVKNQKRTMPVSMYLSGYNNEFDVCLSVPAVIGKGGVLRTLNPTFSEDELEAFHESAITVRKVIKKYGQDYL